MNCTDGSQFCITAAATFGSMWSLWVVGGEHGVDFADSEGVQDANRVAQVRLDELRADGAAVLMPFAHGFDLLRALAAAYPEVKTEVGITLGLEPDCPCKPSHHIANVLGSTSVCSISSLSHVPHSGKVSKIQDSLVISSTLLKLHLLLCVGLLRLEFATRNSAFLNSTQIYLFASRITARQKHVNTSTHIFAHMFRYL